MEYENFTKAEPLVRQIHMYQERLNRINTMEKLEIQVWGNNKEVITIDFINPPEDKELNLIGRVFIDNLAIGMESKINDLKAELRKL